MQGKTHESIRGTYGNVSQNDKVLTERIKLNRTHGNLNDDIPTRKRDQFPGHSHIFIHMYIYIYVHLI